MGGCLQDTVVVLTKLKKTIDISLGIGLRGPILTKFLKINNKTSPVFNMEDPISY